jgi:hypothetical protein
LVLLRFELRVSCLPDTHSTLLPQPHPQPFWH